MSLDKRCLFINLVSLMAVPLEARPSNEGWWDAERPFAPH